MKNLRYMGGDDIREFSPSDLEKLGVEDAEATVTFRKGQSTTLDDSIADVLLSSNQNLRESTPEELEQEERDLEALLGFSLYNPADHSVAEVKEALATSSDARKNYILDQEQAGQNRKTIIQAGGRQWSERTMTEEEMAQQPDAADAEVVDLTDQPEANGVEAESVSGTEGSGGPSGTASTP